MVPEEIHDLNVFMTDVKHVMRVVQIGNDKKRLKDLLSNDKAFRNIDTGILLLRSIHLPI